MLEIRGGTCSVNDGVLFLNGALVEYDERALPSKSCRSADDIVEILANGLPDVDWSKDGHYVCNCVFKYTVFSLLNE